MPLYEYRCEQGHTHDRLCSFDSMGELVWCGKCTPGENNIMRRLISVPRPAVIPGGTNAGYGKR